MIFADLSASGMNTEQEKNTAEEAEQELQSQQSDAQPGIIESEHQESVKKEVMQEEAEAPPQEEDLNQLSLDGLLDRARASMLQTPKLALSMLETIKPVFFDKFNELKQKAKEASQAAEEEEFVFEHEKLSDSFMQIVAEAKKAKDEERKRIEEQKQQNYKRKQLLLDTLSELLEKDETEESIGRVKEIQAEWKQIRVLPKDKVQTLWDRYHMLLDQFYDNHSINIELKELDRRKNLEAKIELTKKVEELEQEKSLKKSFIMLNKYHEEYRHIGPIPKESREAIWQAFKKASDHIYEIKRKAFEGIQEVRKEHLAQKELIIDKLALVAQPVYESVKEWNAKAKEVEQLFEDWKKIGPVPKAQSDSIWQRFKKERNTFYHQRKQFFGKEHKVRKENLKQKEELCKQVEGLQDSEDFANTTNEILKIQAQWKKIGPVPDKVNQAIWGRFRAACDHFFNRKEAAFAGQREAEEANLGTKQGIIDKIQGLLDTDIKESEAFAQLKELAASWRETGFVPRKHAKRINQAYEKVSNAIYSKFNKSREDMKLSQMEDHYRRVADGPQGERRLKDEEYKIRKKIGHLNEEMGTLEQNMSFFAKSKTAEKLLKDFETKLQKTRQQIDRLKSELQLIKKAKAPKPVQGEEEVQA